MATQSFQLGEQAASQLAEVVRRVNGEPFGVHPYRGNLPERAPIWRGYKPTSGPSGVIYTGELITFDGSTETSLATGIKGIAANGDTLTLNTRYPATLIGENSGAPLYMVFRAGGLDVKEEGGSTINATLVEFESEDFDVTNPAAGTAFVRTQGVTGSKSVIEALTCTGGTATVTTKTYDVRRGLINTVT